MKKGKVKKTVDGNVDIDSILSDIDNKIRSVTNIDYSKSTNQYTGNYEDVSTVNKNPNNNNASNDLSDEDDDGEDEVLLIHQLNDAGPIAVNEVKGTVVSIAKNVRDIRQRYAEIDDSLKSLTAERKTLMLQVDTLEEDNILLNTALKEGILSQQQGKYSKGLPVVPGVGISVNRTRHLSQQQDSKTKGENLRKALMMDDDDQDLAVDLDNLFHSTSKFAVFVNWLLKFVPFKDSIRQVQSKHGASVASYFVFSRFIFLQFSIMAVIMAGFTAIHMFNMVSASPSMNLWESNTPQSSYIPKFLMYHSYTTKESVLYAAMSMVCVTVWCGSILEKLLREDRLGKELTAVESEDHHPFATDVLCAWDYSLTSHTAISDFRGSLSNSLSQKLQEDKQNEIRASRTYYQMGVLYLIRCLGLILYLIYQSLSFAIIILLTIYHQQIISQIPVLNQLTAYSAIVVNLSLNVISAISPTVLGMITEMERWDSAQVELNIQLFRLFLSNQLNVLLFVLSYVILGDPYLFAENQYIKDIRNNIGVDYVSGEFNCRLDAVEYQILFLALTSFVSNLVAVLYEGYSPYAIGWFYKTKSEDVEKAKFEIVESMVNLLNFVMIEMLRIPFAPQTFILSPFMLYITIRVEKHVVLNLFSKPRRPWKAQKAGIVFTFFYFMSFILVAVPTTMYFFVSRTFPKSCDIQDTHINVCDSGTYSSTSQLCTVSADNNYYTAFASNGGLCLDSTVAYPKCVCQEACGPFVDVRSNIIPLKDWVGQFLVLKYIWIVLFESSYGPWMVAFVLFLTAASRKNSIKVTEWSSNYKEKKLETHVLSLEAEKRKNDKLIAKLKAL